MFCIACGEPLETIEGKGKFKHVHNDCQTRFKKYKTRYCWMCGNKLTPRNRKGSSSRCYKCNNAQYHHPKGIIKGRKDIVPAALGVLRHIPLLTTKGLFNELSKKKSRQYEFGQTAVTSRVRADDRFLFEDNLWSLNTPEMTELRNGLKKKREYKQAVKWIDKNYHLSAVKMGEISVKVDNAIKGMV